MSLLAHAWILLPAVLLAGGLIGATGIGGVLLVPVLTRFGEVPAPQAIAAASLAFALPALVALRPLAREPALARRTLPLLAGALAGAAGGALLVQALPARVLLGGVTALVLFAGVRGLLAQERHAEAAPLLSAPVLAGLGLLVGIGSALTGTGGPVLLLPLLMLCRQRVDFAVIAAQAVQLPVALTSSAVHAAAHRLDWGLAAACGVLMLLGSLVGQRLAHGLDRQRLQGFVSGLLLIVGAWFVYLLFA